MAEEILKTSEAPKVEAMEVSDLKTEKVSVEEETEKKNGGDEIEKEIAASVSFKEESNKVSDLQDPEKKALDELKQLIQTALINHEFTSPPPPNPIKEEVKPINEDEVKPIVIEEKSNPETKTIEEEEGEKFVETHEKEEEKTTPATVVVCETVVVDEDGTKTVEAIEETIVAVQPTTESTVTPAEEKKKEAESAPEATRPPEEIFIWGIPLIGDEKSDVILLKFLRARDFKVKEAFTMINNTVKWRKEFGIDTLLDEDHGLNADLKKVIFMNGFDREGHPVCYNVYGEFQSKELYSKMFSSEEKRQKFLQWRIQFLEKSIRKLDFGPTGGVSTIVQINDLKNSPGPGKWERQATFTQTRILLDLTNGGR